MKRDLDIIEIDNILQSNSISEINELTKRILQDLLESEEETLNKLPISSDIKTMYRNHAQPNMLRNIGFMNSGNSLLWSKLQHRGKDLILKHYLPLHSIHKLTNIYRNNKKFIHEKLNALLLNPRIINKYDLEKQEVVNYLLKENEYVFFNNYTATFIRNFLKDVIILGPKEYPNTSEYKILYNLEKEIKHTIPEMDKKDKLYVLNSDFLLNYERNTNIHIFY